MRGAAGEEAVSTIYIGSLFEKDSSGRSTRHIFAGANRVATVSLRGGEADEAISYFHSDHLGSSNVITNQRGEQVGYTEFTPFGTTFKQTGTYDPKHKFTGKELDASTGLYFYGARYYDPETGRFITADTIVQAPYDPQTLNRYAYCRNSPLNYTDPTGHFFGWIIAAIIGAVVGAAAGGISAAANGGSIWQGMLFGAVMGAATGALGYGVGSALYSSAMATQASVSVWEGAYITGMEFGITGFGTGLASGYAGGQGSISDMFKQAGIGFGIGLITGGIAGATHAAGWQNFIHGQDFSAEAQLAKGADRVVKLAEQGFQDGAQKLADNLAQRFGDVAVNEAIQSTAEATANSLTISAVSNIAAEVPLEPVGHINDAAFLFVGGINPVRGGQAAVNAATRSLAREGAKRAVTGFKEVPIQLGKEKAFGVIRGILAFFGKNIRVKQFWLKVPK